MWEKTENFFKINQVQVILQLMIRGTVLLLLFKGAATVIGDNKISSNSLLLLVLSGVVNGLNYGFHNHQFLHENKKESDNFLYRSHIIWEHVISGIISSLAVYLLLLKFRYVPLDKLFGGEDFILVIIVLLGYCGFIPMIMWFFSHSLESIQKFIGKKV